jgi:hypothetical protein
MTFTVLFLIVALTPSTTVYAQQPPISRFGVIEIKKDEDRLKHRLLLNGKEIFQYEGQSIDIVDVLNGRGIDYLLVGAYSGGIACPMQVVIIEVHNPESTKSPRRLALVLKQLKRDWSTAE